MLYDQFKSSQNPFLTPIKLTNGKPVKVRNLAFGVVFVFFSLIVWRKDDWKLLQKKVVPYGADIVQIVFLSIFISFSFSPSIPNIEEVQGRTNIVDC